MFINLNFAAICAVAGAGLSIGLGSIGSALGEGIIAMKTVEALGRQPSAAPKLLRTMIIGQAITETSAIFSLVVALILVFQGGVGNFANGISFIAASIAIGFGTIGAGFGAGLPGSAAVEGIGKQPDNADALMVHMIIGQAITQTSGIFALTIALILIMLKPDQDFLTIFALLGAGFAMGFGAIGPGLGDGIVAKNASKSIAKDARHLGLLTRTTIIGQAITETTDIYSMVVALMLIFVV